ncbi:GAF domain-containing protein [bacterium]|nr:GAF domain-containing protein [bacterium]
MEVFAAKNLTMEDMEKQDFERSYQMILESVKTSQVKLDNIDSLENDLLKNEFIKSSICVPLLRRGKPIGVLYHDNLLFQSTF